MGDEKDEIRYQLPSTPVPKGWKTDWANSFRFQETGMRAIIRDSASSLMVPKEGEVIDDCVTLQTKYPFFIDPNTGFLEYGDQKGWRTRWDSTITKWRWTFMGNQQTPQQAMTPVVPTPIEPSSKLDKGDYCQLKASKRKFRIIDERKDDNSNFEELCKFDDDSRNPIWLPHGWLVGEVNILEKAG